MGYYQCVRCGHIVTQKVEILRHLKRKNKCSRNIKSYNYNDEEILQLSLKKHNEPKKKLSKKINIIEKQKNDKLENIYQDNITPFKENVKKDNTKNEEDNTKNEEEIPNLQKVSHYDICIQQKKIDNQITKKKDEDKSKKKHEFICPICCRIFSRKYNLNRHQQKCSNSKLSQKFEENIILNNNTTNNYNTINNNYNKNLFVNFNLEPFDNEWDVSKITKFTKHSILLSKIMYSNLLKTILENEKNLNVLIEKDTNTGLVYKNNVDKFITMNIKDIIEQSMEKLNKHLNDFYKESVNDDEFVIMNKIFENQKINIDNKYLDFKNNINIQSKVQEFITDIFDKKKDHAIKLYNQVLLQNKESNDDGY